MDLSPFVLQGLQVAGSITDKSFSILLKHALDTIIGGTDNTQLQGALLLYRAGGVCSYSYVSVSV